VAVNWLLDTNVCIAALNPRSAAVRGRFSEAVNRGDFLGISAITVFELHYGAAASSRVADNTRRLSIFLASLPELPLESEDARVAGIIRAELRKSGTPIGPYDVLIAGQALRRELVLVTANIREFARVPGLRVENWAS
jgi:tRNA(fMet)-specific endonuclease VapC